MPRLSVLPWHKAATKSGTSTAQERKRTAKLRITLPTGIKIGEWPTPRPKPFYVRYGSPRKLESFITEQDRNDKAEELAGEKEANGSSVLNFDPAEYREFREWKERHQRPMLLAREAVARYMALRLKEDVKAKSDSHIHMQTHLERRFCQKFGHLRLDHISTDMLRSWLETMPNPRSKIGELIGKVTFKHYRKDLNMFFERCEEEGWIAKNPCKTIRSPKVTSKKRKPIPVKDLFHLLKANREQPVIGRLVLELFGGLRCSAVEGLTKADLNFEKRSIHIRRQKVGDEKTRSGHPAVLWEWLKHTPEGTWSMSPSYYSTAKALAFARANVPNPGNGLRHSCASYLLAIKKDYQIVGYLLQHSNRATTMGYEGCAEEFDAYLLYAMTPEAVLLSWEEFVESQTKLIPTK